MCHFTTIVLVPVPVPHLPISKPQGMHRAFIRQPQHITSHIHMAGDGVGGPFHARNHKRAAECSHQLALAGLVIHNPIPVGVPVHGGGMICKLLRVDCFRSCSRDVRAAVGSMGLVALAWEGKQWGQWGSWLLHGGAAVGSMGVMALHGGPAVGSMRFMAIAWIG
jgi:hypothetical protein